MEHGQHTDHNKDHNKHYIMLGAMAVLSFIAMYALMYSMVNKFENVYANINQFYMTATMTMPMVIIEVLLMRHMYHNKKVNAIILGVSALALVGFYWGVRQQVAVNDRQFLKSMIPHHAGAILMCQESDITDPELKKLCEEIVASQQREIDQMKAKLREMK
ncbi:MAG: DUF305 domain-containing protein [Cyclobacteriaceae bacterium]|jgi:uncharacterized protein (DUF305 family)